MSRGQKFGTVNRIQHGRPGKLLSFQVQATDVSPVQCIQIGRRTLPACLPLTKYTHSAALPVRAVPHMSRYLQWGQHYFYRLFRRTSKTAPYLVNSNLITACNEWFWHLHICTYCTDTKHITATILNSLSVKHNSSCKIRVSIDLSHCTSYKSTNCNKRI